MRVAGITTDGDWQFGRGKATYLRNRDAIRQNVVTRIRSFTNDWFLDVSAGLDWFALIGSRNTETRLRRDLERTVLTTDGVRSITRLEIVGRDRDRGVTIELSFLTIFDDDPINQSVTVPV